MDEVNEWVAGRAVLEMGWSADGDRLKVVVFDGLDDRGKVRERTALFERVGDRFLRAQPRWKPGVVG